MIPRLVSSHATSALVIAGGILLGGCPRRPLPLDPLTPQEMQEAEKIARADPQVTALLQGGQTELVYVILLPIKSGKSGAVRDPDKLDLERAADVIFYRFDGDFGVRAIVHFATRQVTVTRLDSADVPISQADWKNALALALTNVQIQAALGPDLEQFRQLTPARSTAATLKQNTVRSLPVTSNDPANPCYHSRCLELRFRKGARYLPATALVNLTNRTVLAQAPGTPPARVIP